MKDQDIAQMSPAALARRLAELGQTEKALEAYTLALKQANTGAQDRFEAACAVLQFGEDYRPAYDAFLALYHEGALRDDALSILTDAFYSPNEPEMRERYEQNCALLREYPYFFSTDLPAFEELPIKFYPYDDNGVVPFYTDEARFDTYINFNEPVIRHHFFCDLEKPVLAKDIFSQYELEYLRDNVRASELVGRENHIYLHYADKNMFCAHLQHLDLAPLLEDQKIIFLFGDEIGQYPINFKERFGIDYSRYTPRPVQIREINKLIWHTQLHAHNGGDFFNEILHAHPNLLVDASYGFDILLPTFDQFRRQAELIAESGEEQWSDTILERVDHRVLREMVELRHPTLKDAMAAYYLGQEKFNQFLDHDSRIVPAIAFQPHFEEMQFSWKLHESGGLVPVCSAYEEIKSSGLLQQFKYIKTFTPIRRPTNSHAATVRFLERQANLRLAASTGAGNEEKPLIHPDVCFDRIMNRSYLVENGDRFFADSRVVRFEDGKLNPKATFTALAEFLDIPYTNSMTYCSSRKGIDPPYEGVPIGMDPAPVYRTYDEFADRYERHLIEYLLRDLYRAYGYDFQFYDGTPMGETNLEELLELCVTNLDFIRRSWQTERDKVGTEYALDGGALDKKLSELTEEHIDRCKAARQKVLRILSRDPSFCGSDGRPLRMMEMLKPDPALLQRPLYR